MEASVLKCFVTGRGKMFLPPQAKIIQWIFSKVHVQHNEFQCSYDWEGFAKYFTLTAKYNDTFAYAMLADVR